MVYCNTRGVVYIRAWRTTCSHTGADDCICAQCFCWYCELHRIALDATLSDKGMVEQGQTAGRSSVIGGTPGLLRISRSSLFLVPSMSHPLGNLARLVEQRFGDGSFALVSIAEGVDTRTDNGRFVLHLLRTLARWDCEGAHNAKF